MYKIITPICLMFLIVSCGGSDDSNSTDNTEDQTDSVEVENTNYPPDTQSWYLTETTNSESKIEKHLNIAISIMGVEDSIYIATIEDSYKEIDQDDFWDSGISMNSVAAVYFDEENILAIERIKSKKNTYLVNVAFYETEYKSDDTENEVMVEQEGAKIFVEDGEMKTDFHFSEFAPLIHYKEADRYWLN